MRPMRLTFTRSAKLLFQLFLPQMIFYLSIETIARKLRCKAMWCGMCFGYPSGDQMNREAHTPNCRHSATVMSPSVHIMNGNNEIKELFETYTFHKWMRRTVGVFRSQRQRKRTHTNFNIYLLHTHGRGCVSVPPIAVGTFKQSTAAILSIRCFHRRKAV